jgi:gliding motility-associated-like protein
MKKLYSLILGLICILLTNQTNATHILGGELTYRYLDANGPSNAPFRFSVRLKAYVDKNSNFPGGNLGNNPRIGVYNADNNQRIAVIQIPNIPNGGITSNVTIPVPPGCVVPGLQSIDIAVNDFTTIINVPFSINGYYLLYQSCCRSCATTNVDIDPATCALPGPSNTPGNTYFGNIPSPIYQNSSPQFLDEAVPFICRGDTVTIANNATDPDGDKLIYSFVAPYDAPLSSNTTGPPATFPTLGRVPYFPGYSEIQPFGPGGVAEINASTGLTKYMSPINGLFSIAIEIKEYRTLSNGVEILLSSTIREFAIVVRDCAPNNAPPNPNEPPGSTGNFTLVRTEGDSVVFNISTVDAEGDSVIITVNSDVISGENGFPDGASRAVAPTVKGAGSASTTFKWKIDCGLTGGIVRSYPVNVRLEDRGCPPKVNNVIYTIIVNPFKAPAPILGRDTICSNSRTQTFRVVTNAQSANLNWRITNGTLLSSGIGDSVRVQWGADTGTVRLISTSGLGCKDSVSKFIKYSVAVPVNLNAPAFVCEGNSITLNATGGYNNYVWRNLSNNQNVGNGSAIIVTPTDTTLFTVTSKGNACTVVDTAEVKWIPKIANAGPDTLSLCSGTIVQIGQPAPDGYSFYSHSWTPSNGILPLQDTLSNPLLVLNTTTNQLLKYTVTSTHRASNCSSKDSIFIRLNALPPVNAGPDSLTLCVGERGLIGTIGNANLQYQWSDISGLFTPTQDTTSILIAADSNFVQHFRYRLTVTDPITNCANVDSIQVKVNPLPFFDLATRDSVCSGLSIQIGTAANAGFTYSWSPSFGLSNPLGAQTTVSLVNSGNTQVDSVYNLQVTNTATGCARTKSISVRIDPTPIADAGPDKSICSGDSVQIGTAALTNLSYTWLPANGLNNASTATPIAGLTNPNVGGDSIAVSYRVNVQNIITGCRNSDSMIVRIKPLPIVDAGADTTTICSKGSIIIGSNALPAHVYTWLPDTALSNASASNPVISINNPSDNRLILNYKVTALNTLTGCRNVDSIKVVVNPLPKIPLAASDSLCSSKPNIIGVEPLAGVSYVWSPTTGVSNPNIANPTFTLINNQIDPLVTEFTLTATINSTGCVDSSKINVLTFKLPDANAGVDKEVCSLDSIEIGSPPVAGFRYEWSPVTGLSNPFISNPKVSFNNESQADSFRVYTLRVISLATGCDSTDNVLVKFKPLPIANAGGNPDSLVVCSANPITLGTTPTADYGYVWQPSTALSDDTIANPVLTLVSGLSEPLVVKYKVNVTNRLNACKKSDSVFVVVNPLPVPVTGVNNVLCSGDTIAIGGDAQLGVNYVWTPATGLSSATIANPLLTLTNNTQTADTVRFRLYATFGATGCRDSSDLKVTINVLPLANAGEDRAICSGDVSILGAEAVSGFTYTWAANSALNNLAIANPTFTADTVTVPSVSELILLVTNALTGCKKADTVRVTTNPRPGPVLLSAFSFTVCPFVEGVVYSVADPTAGFTYNWTVNGGTITSGAGTSTITVNWGATNPNAGITYQPVNLFGCSGPIGSVNININQILAPPVPIGLTELCAFDRFNQPYFIPPTAGSVYTWRVIGGTPDSLTGGPNITVNWTPPQGIVGILINEQSNTVDPVTGTPVQCFGRSDTLFVTINPSPDTTLSIIGATSVCEQTDVNQIYVLNGLPGSQYAWSVQPEIGQIAGTPEPPNTLPVNWLNAGNYTITVLETTDKGCVGRNITQNVVVNALPKPNIGGNQTTLCIDNLAEQTYTVSSSPGFTGSTFNWVILGGEIVSQDDSAGTVIVNWNATDDKLLRVTERTAAGCVKDTVFTLLFDRGQPLLRVVSTEPLNDNFINVNFVIQNADKTPGPVSVLRRLTGTEDWTTLTNELTPTSNFYRDLTANTAANAYDYRVDMVNACGRTNSSDVHTSILLRNVGGNDAKSIITDLAWSAYRGWPVAGYNVLRQMDKETDFSIYQSGLQQTVMREENGKDGFRQCYRIVAEQLNGNLQSLSNIVCINFENEPVFYNLVTANGDGKNDAFEIDNLKLYPENELKIMNRWGKTIKEINNYSPQALWSPPSDLPAGTYYYQFTIKGERAKIHKGWFSVVR